jgi:hypothetical protein
MLPTLCLFLSACEYVTIVCIFVHTYTHPRAGVNVEGESKSGGGALEPVMSKKQMKKRISLVLDVVMSEEDKHPEGLNVGV